MTNSDNFKLSVVIPAYNCAKYIEDTIASVLKQTRSPHEIIVVNDGSTDNTAEVVSKYPGIRLINKINQGPSETRNRGILECTGNWVAFLDSDDIWHSEKIERIEDHVMTNPKTDMLSTAFYIGNPLRGWKKITPRRLFNPNDSFFEQLYRRSFIATSSVVIRKSVLDKIGGFDSSLLVAEDLDLWLRVALTKAHYHYIPEHLLYYRSHDASITSNPLNAHKDIEKVFYKFRRQAGYKLFVKRMIIWNATTTLTLYGQRRYLAALGMMAKLVLTILKSPFVYIHKDDLVCTPARVTTKSS